MSKIKNVAGITIWLPELDRHDNLIIGIKKEKNSNGNSGFDIGLSLTQMFQGMFEKDFEALQKKWKEKIKEALEYAYWRVDELEEEHASKCVYPEEPVKE